MRTPFGRTWQVATAWVMVNLCLGMLSSPISAQSKTVASNPSPEPILFRCDHLLATQRLGHQQCIGHVIVQQATTWLCCDRLDIHLNSQQQPTHLLCTSNVRLQQEGHLAWGAVASFEPDKQLLFLSGEPMVIQESSILVGQTIRFYKDREQMEVSQARMLWQQPEGNASPTSSWLLPKPYQPEVGQQRLPPTCPLPAMPTLPQP